MAKKFRIKLKTRFRKSNKPKNRPPVSEKIKAKAKDFVAAEGVISDQKAPARVTNDTIEKNRREVLSSAKRFIYPLQNSKYKIAYISAGIIGISLLVLVAFSWTMLYQRHSDSDLAYRLSQIMPFPVARVNGHFVRYEEYLFELRQNTHYLTNQENVDFSTEEGKIQLDGLRRQALDRVIEREIIKELAVDNGVSVSESEVDEQIALIRSQGGVGDNLQTLEDTLSDFYGWDLDDLRRVVRSQVLRQKLLPLLDTETKPRAQAVLDKVKAGLDFSKAAKQYSDDALTKDKGGVIGNILSSNTEIPPQIVQKAFELKAGETADELVQTLFGYHIVKTIKYRGPDEAEVAHILFRFKDIKEFTQAKLDQSSVSEYIKF